ncbi:MAG: hypothetical protein LQ349_000547 [Xanthoria aureola]|nr:MAG: hypothetical protein LQ349_000547 [Xanthoria aureola]
MSTSTQDHQGIAFYVAHEQQNLRLLELPPILLELLTSQHPSKLSLKSNVSTEETSGHAVLCSDNQTFQLRQVHSSNSVFLLQPSCIASDADQASASHGITTVAKCEATLEAIPQSIQCTHQLKAAIPVLSNLEVDTIPPSTLPRGKLAIFDDCPFSVREFEQAWKDICALEVDGQAFRPSSEVLWKVWRSIVSGCILKGFSLDQDIDVSSLARTIEEDDVPPFVMRPVVERLRVNNGVALHGYLRMSPVESVQWAGTVLLEARTEDGNAMSVAAFFHDWKDGLPESWRRYATLETIKGKFMQPSEDTIMLNGSGLSAGKGSYSTTTAKSNGPQARRWHEKFKSSRR